jgi:hypothetical protein
MITPNDLTQFTGTENYYKSQQKNLWYSDGARYLFQEASCYWLLDEIQYDILHRPKVMKEDFISVEVNVKEQSANIIVTDGNKHTLYKKHIQYTDLPTGIWKLWIERTTCGQDEGRLILVPSEH